MDKRKFLKLIVKTVVVTIVIKFLPGCNNNTSREVNTISPFERILQSKIQTALHQKQSSSLPNKIYSFKNNDKMPFNQAYSNKLSNAFLEVEPYTQNNLKKLSHLLPNDTKLVIIADNFGDQANTVLPPSKRNSNQYIIILNTQDLSLDSQAGKSAYFILARLNRLIKQLILSLKEEELSRIEKDYLDIITSVISDLHGFYISDWTNQDDSNIFWGNRKFKENLKNANYKYLSQAIEQGTTNLKNIAPKYIENTINGWLGVGFARKYGKTRIDDLGNEITSVNPNIIPKPTEEEKIKILSVGNTFLQELDPNILNKGNFVWSIKYNKVQFEADKSNKN